MPSATVASAIAGQFAPSGTYLDTATVGLPPAGALIELRDAVESWRRGTARAPDYDAHVTRSRAAFARLVGVDPGWVAVGSQVSVMAGLVAASLPAGAEVLCVEGDFTSVLFPFLAQEDRGVRVRLVALDELADAVGPRTSLAAVSAVQSATGAVCDLHALTVACERVGARTFVDATQACGWLALDAGRFDYLACSGYKWLLGPRGAAYMTVRPERLAELRPHAAGWYAGADPWTSIYGAPLRLAADARRLDVSPAWLSWVGAAGALELLEAVGVEAIGAHDVALADALLARLDLPGQGSAICSLQAPADAPQRLLDAGVTASMRGGRLRVAFHLYNGPEDVDRVARALGA